MSSDFRMSGVLLTLALMLLATANVGHCHCPGIHNFGFCAFRIRCVGDIEGVSLPEECQGSVNHPVTVDLTLADAQPFDDNVDTEFLNTITTFRATASWPQTSLSFLTHMTKLKNLILTSNQIETIDGEPFYNLKYLQYLDLSRNALNDIEDLFSFESQNSLKKLLLSYNDIEEIPGDVFSELLNLKELDLSYNKISDLSEEPFCNLTNLEILRLNHNMIRTLNGSVNSLTNLKHLHLKDNQIQFIDVPSLAIIYHLETFDISGNQLDELKPIIFLRHWQHLNHSQLFSGVCKISFAENRITSIPNGTSKELSFIGEATTTSKIDVQTELDLSKNEINIIEFNAFQSINKLIKLDLSCNKLSDFIVYAYDMKDLKYLNLSSNHISNLYFDSFSLMKNLQSLDLSHNKVEYIEDETFTNSHNLKHVNMTFNGITALKNLRIKMFHPDGGVLDLSNNGLSRLGFGLGEGLTILVLNYNNIVDAKYINLRNQNDLTTLEMKNNSIHKLNETSLNLPISLTSLDLGGNRITEIGPSSFHGVSRLNSLFLGHNELKQIEYGAFQGLIHLYNLDLSFNHIKFLDAKVLMDLKSLTILSLRSNKLHYLDYKVWYGHKYAIKVFLEGNSITCDWLASALSDYNNGYSRMRPSVLPYRPASPEHTLDGIPCISKIKEGAPENLKMVDMSARYELGDERLLIINQKILEAIQQQNNYLKTFTNQFNINVNSLILHKLKKRAHILV